MYKVVQIWPGLFVCKQVTVCPGHIWTTLYNVKYESYVTKITKTFISSSVLYADGIIIIIIII
jgi:hypothetical protein